jgi:predicted TIM-barrel fold metal-dependent hydrolase
VLPVGDPTSGFDMAAIMAELGWMADHGFKGAMLANVNARPTPPLHDAYWDPYWAQCVEYGIAVVVHAGYGSAQAEFMTKLTKIQKKMEAEGSTDLLNAIMNNTEEFFALDLRPRRAMWQLMLGGVFDRHPRLRLLQAEIRGDWLPSTLAHLDATYERVRGDVPAKRRANIGVRIVLRPCPSRARRRLSCVTRSASVRSPSAATIPMPRAPGPTPPIG